MAATADIGLVGLGVMGRNLALNMRDRGSGIVGLDVGEEARARARQAGIPVVANIPELVTRIRRPRRILVLLPAGNIIDETLAELLPWLDAGDIVIDGGNSHYKDTMRRAPMLERRDFGYLGLGISGGEEGARRGPSMMAGGTVEAWDGAAPLLQAIAARADGRPCAARMGPDGAGHFVKTVHNGIEYAFMQLIAEAYDILRRLLRLSIDDIATAIADWNKGPLGSFLLEITTDILLTRDKESGFYLVELVEDTAEQKGTGAWASIAALEYGVAAPTIAEAALARALSSCKESRVELAQLWPNRAQQPAALSLDDVAATLVAGQVAAFAQGFDLIRAASEAHSWSVDRARVARVWRAGCIIRARLLDTLVLAYDQAPALPSLLFDEACRNLATDAMPGLRRTVAAAAAAGIPVPASASALAWFDGWATARLPANLVQAQRDRFGAHGFRRVDRSGRFHADWSGTTSE